MSAIITKDILQRMINEASPERKKKIVGRALVDNKKEFFYDDKIIN